jgi:hypothetical protein
VIDGTSGKEKASSRQSTWRSALLSVDRLRRRAATFVPSVRDDARVDRSILELMERRLPLGAIAIEIAAAFPSLFKNVDEALARVGWLSERYSK